MSCKAHRMRGLERVKAESKLVRMALNLRRMSASVGRSLS